MSNEVAELYTRGFLIGLIWQGCKDNDYCFKSLEATMYDGRNGFKQAENRLFSGGQVLRY